MGLWFKPAFAGGPGPLHWFARHGWRRHRHPHARTGDWQRRIAERASGRLGLNAEQRTALDTLLARLQAQRAALRGSSHWGEQLHGLVRDKTFDRWQAQDLLHARVQALREHGPQVIEALAVFYDGLDAQQQHQVRALIERWSD